jgi:hypothetical protein
VTAEPDLVRGYLGQLHASLRTPAPETRRIVAEAEDHLRRDRGAGRDHQLCHTAAPGNDHARPGIFSAQTTNMSILSFIQRLWGLPPLSRRNARQNDLMTAFDFNQSPAAAPQVPQAPRIPSRSGDLLPATRTRRAGIDTSR